MADYIGVDPSLNGTGIAYEEVLATSLIFRGRKADPKGDGRLAAIRRELDIILQGLDDPVAVVEAVPPYGTGSAALGLVQGVVRECLAAHGVRPYLLSATSLKKFATGDGKASKEDMRAACASALAYHPDVAVMLAWDDNAIDAWWLREVAKFVAGAPHAGMPNINILAALKRP